MKAPVWHLLVYRVALRCLPADFRARYGAEMEFLLTEKLLDDNRAFVTLAESCNVLASAIRVRLGRHPLQVPALITVALLLMLVRTPNQAQLASGLAAADSVDFVARDPAGQFTLHLRYGRAVGGTIDHHRLSHQQLIQTSDSIRVLNPRGRVLFAVAYDREAARIKWAARPAECRGRALECEAAP